MTSGATHGPERGQTKSVTTATARLASGPASTPTARRGMSRLERDHHGVAAEREQPHFDIGLAQAHAHEPRPAPEHHLDHAQAEGSAHERVTELVRPQHDHQDGIDADGGHCRAPVASEQRQRHEEGERHRHDGQFAARRVCASSMSRTAWWPGPSPTSPPCSPTRARSCLRRCCTSSPRLDRRVDAAPERSARRPRRLLARDTSRSRPGRR